MGQDLLSPLEAERVSALRLHSCMQNLVKMFAMTSDGATPTITASTFAQLTNVLCGETLEYYLHVADESN